MEKEIKKSPFVLSDRLRIISKNSFTQIGQTLHNLGISANLLTLVGFIGHLVATYLVIQNQLFWAAIIMIIAGLFDALDGAVARASGKATSWGAFFDSFTDRYAEIFLIGGLLVYFLQAGDTTAVIVAYAAITGSLMVSYARARAHSLNYDVREGAFSRFERYIVMFIALLLNVPFWGLVILTIGSHITALQRAHHFFKNNRPDR